jgi:hypothetical protein
MTPTPHCTAIPIAGKADNDLDGRCQDRVRIIDYKLIFAGRVAWEERAIRGFK